MVRSLGRLSGLVLAARGLVSPKLLDETGMLVEQLEEASLHVPGRRAGQGVAPHGHVPLDGGREEEMDEA